MQHSDALVSFFLKSIVECLCSRHSSGCVYSRCKGRDFLAHTLTYGLSTYIVHLLVQGIGRHSFEYIQQRIGEEIAAVAALLKASDGDFLLGSMPCQADCFLVALLEVVRSRGCN